MIVVSRFMIPPGTCCIQPPTTKIGTTTLFTQKLDHPLIKNPGYGGGNEMTKEEAGIYSVKQID